MNMRQHKRWVMARQLAPFYFMREGNRILNLAAMVKELPNIAPEYRCVKVNGGEVVDTFQTRSEALALMLKHAKQRKAKLQVINTDTGELEVFSELETA